MLMATPGSGLTNSLFVEPVWRLFRHVCVHGIRRTSLQPLNPQAALAEVNSFRAENGLKPLVLDARLSRAAAMQKLRRDVVGSAIMDPTG